MGAAAEFGPPVARVDVGGATESGPGFPVGLPVGTSCVLVLLPWLLDWCESVTVPCGDGVWVGRRPGRLDSKAGAWESAGPDVLETLLLGVTIFGW